jgi:hypothetical protein
MVHGTVRLYPPLNMLLEYVIESRLSSRDEVEVFGEDWAREASARFGC